MQLLRLQNIFEVNTSITARNKMTTIEDIDRMTEKYYREVGKLNLLHPGIENAENQGRREAAERLCNRAYELCFDSYMEIQNRIMPEIRKGKLDAHKLSSTHLERRFGLLEFEMMAVANSYARTMNSMLKEFLHLHDLEFKFNPPETRKKKQPKRETMDLDEFRKYSGYDGWLNPDIRYGEEK
jgi:hypothetical protein